MDQGGGAERTADREDAGDRLLQALRAAVALSLRRLALCRVVLLCVEVDPGPRRLQVTAYTLHLSQTHGEQAGLELKEMLA